MVSSYPSLSYDDPAYDYQEYWHQREYENQADKNALRRLFQLIPAKETIVDIGAGFGRLAPVYAPLFHRCLLIALPKS